MRNPRSTWEHWSQLEETVIWVRYFGRSDEEIVE
jgi:hypothetical protein